MRSVFAFQLLPNHAIERIVDHVTGSSRVLFDGVKPNSNEYRTMLGPLLSVCQGFRTIALARYCSLCKLELASSYTYKKAHSRASKSASQSADRRDRYGENPNLRDFGYHLLDSLGHPTHHLAKELIIELDEGDMYSGEALRVLTHAPYEACAFPLVRKITFRIFMDITDEDYEGHLRKLSYKRRMRMEFIDIHDSDSSYDSDVDDDALRPNANTTTDLMVLDDNTHAFMLCIEEMAPLVDEVDVQTKPYSVSEECEELYSILVTQLFQLGKRITYGDYSLATIPVDLDLDLICDLVHLGINVDSDPNPFVELVQLSALTLQSLIIGPNSFVDLEDIIQGTEGFYVEYPCLLTLKLLEMEHVDVGESPAFPGAVPFPSLRHLHIAVIYPFTDDTIFQGNAATLEYLKLELDEHSYSVVYECNVFTPGSHPKLRCVDITFSDEVMPGPDTNATEYLRYVLNIGSQATVRTINGHLDDKELVQTLYLFEDFTCIQVLSLSYLRLDFWDIIKLIERLPLLSDLTTAPPNLERLPTGITTDELPEFMVRTFSTLSERLRCWPFMLKGLVSDKGIVKAVLSLALVCPNFVYAAPLPTEREGFMRLMEETIATDYFQHFFHPHIVKLIVDHVAFSSRLVYAGFDDDEVGNGTHTKLQAPLLVCHNFRTFVYERFFKRYRLEVYSNNEKPYSATEFWPYRHRNPDNPTHHIAKELTFNFDAWAVYSGKALAQMSMAPFEGCPFPQVRELLVTLYINPKDDDEDCHHLPVVTEDYPLETAANTTAFVQRLKQMAPGINEVDVEVLLGDMEEVLLANCSVHDMELARQLFGIADNMVAITPGSAPLVMYMDLEPLRSLVRIDIEIDGCTDAIVPVVRRNIQTLEVFAVSVGGLAGITGLIQNTSVGDYLEYPCLHTLKLYKFNGLVERERPVFPGAVPFPNLRHLTLWSRYPFGDDVPFRGNTASFAYLDMVLDKSLMTVISKHDVFMPTSHPKLHCVIIDSLERRTTIEHSEFPTYLQFVLSIGPGAPVREYGMPKFGNYLLGATPLHCELASIQVLDITRTPVDLWDVLALLKLLPLLSDLTSLPPRLGIMPTGITKAKLQAHVISTYSPMAKRFRCWRFWDSRFGDYTDIVMCVVLVALVCPNFDYVAPRPNELKQYAEKLEETIATRGFKKHAPRLRRLLFCEGKTRTFYSIFTS